MKTGASLRAFIAGAMRAKSISSRNPERSRCESMEATLESRRRTSCSLLISRLKTPTVLPRAPRHVRRVEREAGLADARPGRQHDQVARLEAGRELVQVRKTRGDADDLASVGREGNPAGRRASWRRALRALKLSPERRWLTANSSASDRSIELLMSGPFLVADSPRSAGGLDQPPEQGLALDDPAVLRDVDGGGSVVCPAWRGSLRRRRPPAPRRAPAPPRP